MSQKGRPKTAKSIWSTDRVPGSPPGLKRIEEDVDGTSFLQKLARVDKTPKLTETQRVIALQEVSYPKQDLTARYAQPGGTWELRPIQSQALAALEAAGGGLFSIGVGWGKTLIGMLAARAIGAKFTIFLAPASTVAQLEKNYKLLKRQFDIGPMSFVSYGKLSRPDGAALLTRHIKRFNAEDIVLVCDEVHKIKRKQSARTKRVIRFLQANPEIHFVGMSGTLTSKGLKDMAHIAEMALKDNSPLPRNQNHLNSWSECIDVDGQPGQSDWEVVRPLWEKYTSKRIFASSYRDRRATIRKAFQKRFRTSPGVVCSEQGALGCSLEVIGRELKIPDIITQTLEQVQDTEETPSGDAFIDDAAKWRGLQQVSSGFYYRWDWPDDEPDVDWLDARYEWNRCVRRELLYDSAEGYDSPLLVANSVAREYKEGKRGIIHRAWLGWMGSGLNKIKPPPTVTVWLDDYLIRDALAWAEEQKEPCILWYQSRAVGGKLAEHGIPVYGAGNNPPEKGPTCAMSIRAHGVGKNLQHGWRNQLILEPPSSGTIWEQLLGRTHRPGQEADTVEAHVYCHTPPFARALKSAKEDAQYIEQSTGSRQKLVYCVYGGALI